MRDFQRCIAAVVEAAGAAADAADAGADANAGFPPPPDAAAAAAPGKGRKGKEESEHETVFSRLRGVAPAVVADAADAADADASAKDFVLRESGILYSAGIDTTSQKLAFTLALLASHPEAMRRVEEELESKGLLQQQQQQLPPEGGAPPPPRALEFADLSRSSLPFLHACLMESMRLVPVLSGGTVRAVGPGGFEVTVPEWREDGEEEGEEEEGEEKEGLAGGAGAGGGGERRGGKARKARAVVIPEGCQLWVPFYLIHRSEELWGPDAAEFKPERFLGLGSDGNPSSSLGDGGREEEEEEAGATAKPTTTPPRRFFPFSHGSRECVGQILARAAMISILGTLLGRVSFSLDREKMGGSLLPAGKEAEAGAGDGGQRGGGGSRRRRRVSGVGDGVFEREGTSFTMTVRGGIWLLATPRAAAAGAAAADAATTAVEE